MSTSTLAPSPTLPEPEERAADPDLPALPSVGEVAGEGDGDPSARAPLPPPPATRSTPAVWPTATATGAALPLLVRRRRPRRRARQTTRVLRGVSPWSVLRVAVPFYLSLWLILLVAGVLLWRVGRDAGVIGNVERFYAKALGERTFEIDGAGVFQASLVLGGLLTVAATGFTVLLTVLLNLITDLVGGIRVAVLELEPVTTPRPRRAWLRSARPAPPVPPAPPAGGDGKGGEPGEPADRAEGDGDEADDDTVIDLRDAPASAEPAQPAQSEKSEESEEPDGGTDRVDAGGHAKRTDAGTALDADTASAPP